MNSRHYPVILWLTIIAFESVDGELNCYHCESHKGLQDCINKQVEHVGCKNSSLPSSCYIFESVNSDGDMSVGKNCIATKMCNKKVGCHPNSSECQVKCCSSPLCNVSRSTVLLPSVTLLLLLASLQLL